MSLHGRGRSPSVCRTSRRPPRLRRVGLAREDDGCVQHPLPRLGRQLRLVRAYPAADRHARRRGRRRRPGPRRGQPGPARRPGGPAGPAWRRPSRSPACTSAWTSPAARRTRCRPPPTTARPLRPAGQPGPRLHPPGPGAPAQARARRAGQHRPRPRCRSSPTGSASRSATGSRAWARSCAVRPTTTTCWCWPRRSASCTTRPGRSTTSTTWAAEPAPCSRAGPSGTSGAWAAHYAGSNFFWYLKDPAGNFSEYYSDMDCIVDDQLWTPEDLEGARGLFAWGPPPPPSFLHPDDLAAMMTGAHSAR